MHTVKPKHQTSIILLSLSVLLCALLVLDFGDTAARADEKAGAKAKPTGKEWRAPEAACAVPNPIKPSAESIGRGQTTYEKSCAKCHGAEGRGDGKMVKALKAKPADLTLLLPQQTDGEIFWKISEGKSPMPAFKKDLKPEQRWDVVNYLRKIIPVAEKESGTAGKVSPAAVDSAAAKSSGN
jgi:mono/diheme cytochrome c family protein